MTLTRTKPDSSSERPIRLAMRADLVLAPQTVAGRRFWAIKDPVAMSYFRLRDEEVSILQMLDGRTSAAEILKRFARSFAPRRITSDRLHAFVARLHRDGLVVAQATGQGSQLLDRADRASRRRRVTCLANPLAIRLPGFNASRLLEWLEPLARVAFSRTAVVLVVSLILSAAALVMTHFAAFQTRLPEARSFLTPRNAVVLLAAISLVKVLHELGHALMCRRFGGECHEIGPMLLMFAPCLYCDVSDSWMFASRWQRIAVAAAGIYVELALAAAATFFWWWSEPGLANSLALDIMMVCSVGTVFFNANPLLRYDGYYILSDLVEIPNLAEHAATASRAFWGHLLLGEGPRNESAERWWQQPFLIAYALAALVYRWAVAILLLWFSHRTLVPYRAEVLAVMLSAIVLAGMLAEPAMRGVRYVRTPVTHARRSRWRGLIAASLAALAVAAVALVPLPVHITAPVVVEPAGAHRIYVTESGTLVSGARAGQEVQAGETLAVLADADLDLEILRLTGQRDQQRLRLENLERRRGQDQTAAAEIPAARQSLADLDERLNKRQADRESLVLKAPVAGTVLPPAWRTVRHVKGVLPQWQGTPLSPENQGALLESGTLLCLVGDPRSAAAMAVVDQADVQRVAVGQRAQISLDQGAGQLLTGTISEVAEIDLDVAPRQLAYGGALAVREDATGDLRPASRSYQVRIEFDATDEAPLLGAPGRVRIRAPSESLWQRLHRLIRGTFYFTA